MTQNAAILAHLQTGQTLTPLEAFSLYGCLALHSRIAELRKDGHAIVCSLKEVGSGKRVGLYRLVEAS